MAPPPLAADNLGTAESAAGSNPLAVRSSVPLRDILRTSRKRTVFEPVHDELDVRGLPADGRLPLLLSGVYLRNGPNPATAPGPNHHVFDGDGMVHGVWFSGGQATRYKNRWVRTRGLERDLEAQRPVHAGIGAPHLAKLAFQNGLKQPLALGRLLSSLARPDRLIERAFDLIPIKNAANTSVLRHAGRLFALWECGMPYELTNELETLGEAGFADLQPSPFFSAHPKIDPSTGELHTCGVRYYPRPAFHYYAYDRFGRLTQNALIPLSFGSLIHDFALTDRHLVIVNCPLIISLLDAPFGSSGKGFQYRSREGTEIIVVDRAALRGAITPTEVARAVVLRTRVDAFFALHMGRAFSMAHSVELDVCAYAQPPLGLGSDRPSTTVDPQPQLKRLRLDLASGRAELCDAGWGKSAEFPVINEHYRGRGPRYTYFASVSGRSTHEIEGFDTIARLDSRSGRVAEYVYQDELSFESAFACNPAGHAEDSGYLLNTSWSPQTDVCHLNVFDAAALDRGPLARVRLPHRIPAGFHATWLPDEPCRAGCPVCGEAKG